MVVEIESGAIDAIVGAYAGSPFDVLGPHAAEGGQVSVRAFRPTAMSLYVVDEAGGDRVEMRRLRPEGFFEATIPGTWPGLRYRYEAVTHDGQTETFHDPYAFREPLLTDYDRYLFAEGRYLYSYEKFGAHLREIDGVKGVNFAVWAPNAYRVSVRGSFNNWDARAHPMQFHKVSGIWELFIPGLDEGTSYKYDLRSHNQNYHGEKADPYGFYAEVRPLTGSIVADLNTYKWQDQAWMTLRASQPLLDRPMSIYEVHLGSWRRNAAGKFLTYRELAQALVEYVKDMGYTHIELMPVAEHPLDASWGYQVTGFYAPTSRYGSPQDFMYLVDVCHQHGIGVIVDWVPAHFPKDGFGLSYFDGTHLYSHEDARKGEHPDWGTYIFNYGRGEVRNFLISNALFWLQKYHIDGLRVDAVSSMLYLDFGREHGQWIPNQYGGNENLEAIEFLRHFNEVIHAEFPGAVTVAEESTAWPMVSRPVYVGGLGFTFKWNMGWMHDTLEYMQKDPIYRRYEHNKITFSIMYAFSENFVLSLSHDEVVHLKGSMLTKMSGYGLQKFDNLRLLYGYQWTHPGKKLLFMGQEIGQWREWSEARELDWNHLDYAPHTGIRAWVRDLNRLYQQQPALYEQDFSGEGFRWIDANDADNSVLTYLRFARDPADFLVIACNFTPITRTYYRIGVPQAGQYRELLNSDSEFYGGHNVGNTGSIETAAVASHGYEQSLSLTLPPLGMIILKLDENADST
jgi:1,4-alpha-glucan branching enzyme